MRWRARRGGTCGSDFPEPSGGWTASGRTLEILHAGRLATLDGGALLRHAERRIRNEAGGQRSSGDPTRAPRDHA